MDWVAKCGRNENDLNFFMTVPLMSNVHVVACAYACILLSNAI